MAENLGFDTTLCSREIGHLEQEGYVTPTSSGTKSEESHLNLTVKGKELDVKHLGIAPELNERFFIGFSDEERRTAYDMVTRMIRNIR